jgi:hypothetical protein
LKENVKDNREQADRLKTEFRIIEAEQAWMIELLIDRDIASAAKQAINRKLADSETRRADMQKAIDDLRENANGSAEELVTIVRDTYKEAKQNLANAATPVEFNRFVEQFVGPLVLSGDGEISKTKEPAAVATGSIGLI